MDQDVLKQKIRKILLQMKTLGLTFVMMLIKMTVVKYHPQRYL